MFYAKQIKAGQSVQLAPEDGGEILHISQVCMSKPVDANRTYLKIVQGTRSFAACVLQKDKTESCSVDLFLSARDGLQLTVEGGKNELSVIGYFEPEAESGSDDDEHMGAFGEDSDESEGVDTDHMSAPVVKDGRIEDLDCDEPKKKGQKSTNKPSQKALQMATSNDDDDDEDDDDDNDSQEDDDDQNSDEESAEDTDEEPAAPVETKRKASSPPQANKKAKTQAGDPQSSKGDDDTYKVALVEFLKKNGRTPLASLGQKVKKPASIAKMANFLKSKPDVFVLEGGFCSLKRK